MAMLLEGWALPIRLVNQATNPWWTNPVATAFMGFLLGLVAEPLKRRIAASYQKREALRRLYDDIGRYLGRVEALSLLDRLDLLLWREVINPQVPNFDYYDAHEPGVLLQADEKRGVYMLVERIRGLASAYRDRDPILPAGGTDDNLAGTFFRDVLYRYKELLKDSVLDKTLLAKAAKKHRQPIANDRPALVP